jgi:hypothetical protein
MFNPEKLTPILYKHYFGDWQNVLDIASQSNPYLLQGGGSQTPPLGNIFLNALSILGPRYSYFIFLGVTLLVWTWLFRKAIQGYPFLYTILAVSLYFILTLPAIYSFDRGSLHIFAVGVIGIAWRKYLEERYLFAGAFFILAVSLKPQLSVFLLLLLLKLDYRNVLRALLGTVFINSVILLVFFSQPIKSAVGFLKGTLFFATANSSGYILDSASLMGFLSRRIESVYGSDNALRWLSDQNQFLLIPSIILIFAVVPVIFFSKVNQRVKIFFVLSLFSLAIPASMHYTLTWASLAIIPFLSNQFDIAPSGVNELVRSRVKNYKKTKNNPSPISSNWQLSDFIGLLTIALLLSPSFMVYWTGARNTSVIRDLYPCMVLVTIVIAYLENFVKPVIKSKRSRATTVSLGR